MSHNRKLSDDQVRQIRAETGKIGDRALARKFGVHRMTITHVVAGTSYAGVEPAVEPRPRPWRFYGDLQPRWGR